MSSLWQLCAVVVVTRSYYSEDLWAKKGSLGRAGLPELQSKTASSLCVRRSGRLIDPSTAFMEGVPPFQTIPLTPLRVACSKNPFAGATASY